MNVARYRIPEKISIYTPRSYCDNCKRAILWYDNIPIISWLILLGKCRYCNWKIPYSYPLIELISGLVYGLNLYGLEYQGKLDIINIIGISVFSTIVLIIGLIDYDKMIIPNNLILYGSIAGLIFNFAKSENTSLISRFESLGYYVISGLSCLLFLEVITII